MSSINFADPAEGCLSQLKNSNRYYETNEGKTVLEKCNKLWKHHAIHLKEMNQRNEHRDQQTRRTDPKFKIDQPVMVKNHACHTFEPKYLPDYRVPKILNDRTVLLVALNGKKRKTNINDVKPCSTSELLKAWNSFLGSIKINHQPRP